MLKICRRKTKKMQLIIFIELSKIEKFSLKVYNTIYIYIYIYFFFFQKNCDLKFNLRVKGLIHYAF